MHPAWMGKTCSRVWTEVSAPGRRFQLMRIEFSRFVEGDLSLIADYIAEDNPPARSASFGNSEEIGRIGRNPLLYELRPDVGKQARLRSPAVT